LYSYSLTSCETLNGLLYYKGYLAILNSLRRQVIQEIYNGFEIGYSGIKKTLIIVKSLFRWPTIYKDTKRFIDNYYKCRRAKPRYKAPAGLLIPLPILDRLWLDIVIDFVTGLPLCKNIDAILIVVDRLSKERYYIAYKAREEGTTTEQTARLLYKYI